MNVEKKRSARKHDPRNAIFIINPVSGTGSHKRRKNEIETIAKDLGWRGKMIATTKSRNARVIAVEEIAKGAQHIVICGGDGTIMEVLQVVINTDIVLGIVPLGTGNLFAENLNITGSRRKIIEQALFGKPHKVDVGRANKTIFAIIAGMGFDAEIMKEANRKLKDRFGLLAYLIIGLKIMYRRPGLYRVTVDQKATKVYRAKSILVANMGKLQGGFQLVPKAHWKNGTLQIAVIQAHAFPTWMSILGNALMGNINKSPHYTLLKGRQITIEPVGKPKVYQCDGNNFSPTSKLEVEICPQAVTVLTDGTLKR